MKKVSKEESIKMVIENTDYNYLMETLEFCVNNVDKTKWDSKTTKEAFKYYNYYFNTNEVSYFCGACRSKVNRGLKHLIIFLPETMYKFHNEEVSRDNNMLSLLKLRELILGKNEG